MKQIKYTLKACAQHWREWSKMLCRDYLLLALAATVVMVALLVIGRDTLLPLWICGNELGDWQLVLSVVPLNIVWLVVLVAGLSALGYSLVRGHLAMRRFVRQYAPLEMGRQQRAALVTLLVMLMLLFVVVLWLPAVTLTLSTLAAAYSGMMQDAIPTPVWMWVAFVACGLAAVLLCEVLMTFCRLCFRVVPEKETAAATVESAEEAADSDNNSEK